MLAKLRRPRSCDLHDLLNGVWCPATSVFAHILVCCLRIEDYTVVGTYNSSQPIPISDWFYMKPLFSIWKLVNVTWHDGRYSTRYSWLIFQVGSRNRRLFHSRQVQTKLLRRDAIHSLVFVGSRFDLNVVMPCVSDTIGCSRGRISLQQRYSAPLFSTVTALLMLAGNTSDSMLSGLEPASLRDPEASPSRL